jgi:predicted DNA-binding transcriptional regulator YafY
VSAKLRRWTDLLASLLRHHFPVTFEELRREVPDYQGDADEESVRRKFERDKKELRTFGVPIQTVEQGGEVVGYQLSSRDFYLPYLTVRLEEGGHSTPQTVDRNGYRALQRLAFEPDELAAVVEAARRVVQLDDPVLSGHVRSAMRKLAFDLPVDAVASLSLGAPAMVRLEERGVSYAAAPRRVQPEREIFELLDDALARRKRVTFEYFSMGSGTASERTAHPYGLFFLGQHWYLAAAAPDDPTVKNYRLNRISGLEVSATKPGSPDYAVPAGFRLREHARSKHAWELGDAEALEVVVDFRTEVGAAAAAATLGHAVHGDPRRRSFQVRRLDAFVRWLLALGDAVEPVGPEVLVDEYRRQAEATLAVYAGREGA